MKTNLKNNSTHRIKSKFKKPARKIIIGLTGPVGSGCSELAEIFDDDINNVERDINKCALVHYLRNAGYIEIDWKGETVKPVHSKIDSEIVYYFKALSSCGSKIDDADSFADKKDFQEKQRNTFKNLKEELEFRETLKSLDYLDEYIDFVGRKHKFTKISLSDLIIYNVLCNYHKLPRYHKDFDKKSVITSFIDVVKQKETDINKVLHLIRYFYPKAGSLQKIRDLLKRKNLSPEDKDKTAQILRQLVKLSKDIKCIFKKEDEDAYRTLMQDFGDNIRRCGNPFNYLASYKKHNHEKWCRDIKDIINFLYFNRGYSFFILDSFRNPYEALYFQDRYTDFYLISVNASESIRRIRLESKFDVTSEKRDQGEKVCKEEIFYKQHVPRTVKLSDIAINNDDIEDNKTERQSKLIKKMSRYLSLIFDAGCTKPKNDEIKMNLAYTTAMKSNCISRQVGAVIVGKDGYVVGAGWNDVGEGQVSCGLREIKDLESGYYDNYIRVFLNKEDDDEINDKERQSVIDMLMRDYLNEKIEIDEIERFCFCFKDEFSRKKIKDKLKDKDIDAECSDHIEKLGIKRLEYCQALHAEENAIIQGAKIGGMGLQGASIYTTAFPCELCAKKIQQVGIDHIVYTEPYPGNISEDIYLKSHVKRIETEQFEGVMPRGYFKLFKVTEDQKEWQELRCRKYVD